MNTSASNLSLEQKLGQLLVVGFQGTLPDEPSVRKVLAQAEAGLIGGIIIFRYNVQDAQQLPQLLRCFNEAHTPLPLLVMLDQEGGKVQRLTAEKGFQNTPSAQQVGASASLEEARLCYEAMAKMLRRNYFNFNCAPCVDLNPLEGALCPVIGGVQRSYSCQPSEVERFAGCMIRALHSERVLSCLKHFPGHGRAMGDSHLGLVDITQTWTEEELLPYKGLIEAGLADAVMPAHLVHNTYDPEVPVSFSSKWVQRLRGELAFKGLIVSDDLHMGAIIERFSPQKALVSALRAGLNLLVFSNNPLASKAQGIRHADAQLAIETRECWQVPDPDLPEKLRAIAQAALSSGELDPHLIEDSFERVVQLKRRL